MTKTKRPMKEVLADIKERKKKAAEQRAFLESLPAVILALEARVKALEDKANGGSVVPNNP